MFEISVMEYQKLSASNRKLLCNHVYALSIRDGNQTGNIYVDCIERPNCVLLWHYCGFAYIAGTPNIEFLNRVYELMINKDSRRLVLQVFNSKVDRFFIEKDYLVRGKRYCYSYVQPKVVNSYGLQDEYSIKEMDLDLLNQLAGVIIPLFSWQNYSDFIKKGKAFCILHENEIAAVAFSSAISHDEIDIGIETSENYRGKGLASAVALKMIKHILSINKKPVWECDIHNMGSCRTAKRVGFEIIETHPYFTKA